MYNQPALYSRNNPCERMQKPDEYACSIHVYDTIRSFLHYLKYDLQDDFPFSYNKYPQHLRISKHYSVVYSFHGSLSILLEYLFLQSFAQQLGILQSFGTCSIHHK